MPILALHHVQLAMPPGGEAEARAFYGGVLGLLTAPLLARAARVYAVEPNVEMRQAAEDWLDDQPGFVSVDGSAEATTLPDTSVDLITAGQAFHWFDRYQVDGYVDMAYETQLFYGRLSG